MSDRSVDALLAQMRAQFVASLAGKAREIQSLASSQQWNALRQAAHKLRGSSASYGFVSLGAAAGAIEDLLLVDDGQPDAGAIEQLMDLTREMDAQVAHAATELARMGPVDGGGGGGMS